jgi:predicted dehydrogenase
MEQVRFGVVGTGWRGEFFLRLASMAPEHLRVTGVVTRSPDRAAEIAARSGVPAYQHLDELVAAERPEFVALAVPWEAMPGAIEQAVALDLPVLAETPPAPTLDGLRRLWAAVAATGLVQVAEQYLLMPGHAARLEVVRRGTIGDVTSVQVSSTHMYHATSMIRHLLGAGHAVASAVARTFRAPVADPLSPKGWSGSAEPRELGTTIALLDFGDGRSAVYDFTENQWWNPLRARRLVIRGTQGEIVDDDVVRLVDPLTPVASRLQRRQLGVDLNLEGVEVAHVSFDGEVVWRNGFPGCRFSDDDLAVAEILRRTGWWARGDGPPPYPLAEACQDHALALAVEQAARTGVPVTTQREPWAR